MQGSRLSTTVVAAPPSADENVRRAAWDGGIPIVFTLHQNDLTTFDPPLPYYIVAPRGSYLPLVTASVREHFMLSAPVLIDEMWFDYKGIPLKWHHPVGVLFDMLHANSFAPELPWPLTVHFHEFPEQDLLRCPNEETIKNHFMNTLKEANYIKFGDNAKVNKLSLPESTALWDGLRSYEHDTFWHTNKLLVADASSLKHVPVRLCYPQMPSFLQDLVNPKDEKGNERTLASVLSQFLPDVFPPPSATSTTTSPAPPQSPSISTPPPVVGSPPSSPASIALPVKPSGPVKVMVQGIFPAHEATIVWLYENLSHPDNFLYIVILPMWK